VPIRASRVDFPEPEGPDGKNFPFYRYGSIAKSPDWGFAPVIGFGKVFNLHYDFFVPGLWKC